MMLSPLTCLCNVSCHASLVLSTGHAFNRTTPMHALTDNHEASDATIPLSRTLMLSYFVFETVLRVLRVLGPSSAASVVTCFNSWSHTIPLVPAAFGCSSGNGGAARAVGSDTATVADGVRAREALRL